MIALGDTFGIKAQDSHFLALLQHAEDKRVHYNESKLKRIRDKVKKEAKIEGLRLYDATRHSLASQLANGGAPLLNVSRLMGHTTTKTTERYYAHSSADALRATVEKMSLKNVVNITTFTRLSPKVENGQN